jgi:hypothetical protein
MTSESSQLPTISSSTPSNTYGFRLNVQSLIMQAGELFSKTEQAVTCIQTWSQKHMCELDKINKALKSLIFELEGKSSILGMKTVGDSEVFDFELRMKRGAASIY